LRTLPRPLSRLRWFVDPTSIVSSSCVLKICLLRSYYPDVLEEHGMYAQTVLLFL
jgi:hypothetical protein